MPLLLILPALAVFLFSASWSVRSIRVSEIFHNPLVIPVLFWLLGYPTRYLLALGNQDLFSKSKLTLPSLNSGDVQCSAVLFSAAFVAMIGLGLRQILPLRARTLSPVSLSTLRFTSQDRLIIHFVFLVYILSFISLTTIGVLTGLYSDFSQLKKSILQIILGEFVNLKWFVATLCMLAFSRSSKTVYLVEAFVVFASVVLTGFLTSSKGVFINIVIFLLLNFSILGRRPPYIVISLMLGFGVAFGLISYQIRELAFTELRDPFASLSLLSNYALLAQGLDSFWQLSDNNILILIDRITYYGDALVLMINGAVHHRNDLYSLGSLVEIGNLVPTFIWEERPHLSFNHYVTGAVWGIQGLLSETPIGRIGEAFYVGHWLGFMAGILYAFIFSLFCLLWHRVRYNIFGLASWSALYMAWVVPDAYFTYGLKQVLFIGLVAYFFIFLSSTLLKLRGRRFR